MLNNTPNRCVPAATATAAAPSVDPSSATSSQQSASSDSLLSLLRPMTETDDLIDSQQQQQQQQPYHSDGSLPGGSATSPLLPRQPEVEDNRFCYLMGVLDNAIAIMEEQQLPVTATTTANGTNTVESSTGDANSNGDDDHREAAAQ